MEDPVAEIPHVIRQLCQKPPSVQHGTLERYFAPNASFTHPFCRTGSFNGSRWLIECIYKWYKILSPQIEMCIDSTAYDAKNLVLYVSIRQIFKIWFIPYHTAPVSLVTVLHLEKEIEHASKQPRYLIKSQNDLYQVNEFVKFFSVLRIVWVGVVVWQFVATALCVFGAVMGSPVSWIEECVLHGNGENTIQKVVDGEELE